MVFFSLKIQRRLWQTRVYCNFFYCLKRSVSQTFKNIGTGKMFSPLCMLLAQLALINVFIPCDNWKIFFFSKKQLVFTVRFFQPPCSFFLSLNQVNWKNSVFCFFFYLHNTNIKIKVQCKHPSSKMKLPHYFSFLMHHILLCKCNVFKKLQTSLEACFL